MDLSTNLSAFTILKLMLGMSIWACCCKKRLVAAINHLFDSGSPGLIPLDCKYRISYHAWKSSSPGGLNEPWSNGLFQSLQDLLSDQTLTYSLFVFSLSLLAFWFADRIRVKGYPQTTQSLLASWYILIRVSLLCLTDAGSGLHRSRG